MLASIPLPLFIEWMDYYELEPFGEERGDLRCAIIAQVIASCHAAKGKRYKVADFMPSFGRRSRGARRPKQSTAQMKATFMAFAEAQNKMMAKKKRLPGKTD